MEALESVIGDGTSLGGKLEATQADVEVLNIFIFYYCFYILIFYLVISVEYSYLTVKFMDCDTRSGIYKCYMQHKSLFNWKIFMIRTVH